DEQAIRFLLSEVLAKDGHHITSAPDGDTALEKLRAVDFDLVISDLHMHEVDGIAVLKAAKKKQANTEVLILTGHGTVSSAVEAMRLGAYEYLTKPIDLEEFRLKVRQALERRDMRLQIEAQRRQIQAQQQMIARDLKLAAQVQQSLVPHPINNSLFEVDIRYWPMIDVGGDFSDVYFDGHDHLYLTLVDVTGHGITAALLVNRMSSEIRRLVRENLEPRHLLHQFNEFVLDAFAGTGMFLTMFACTLQLSAGKLTYAGSAHPAAILWRHGKKSFEKLQSQNPIIGFDHMSDNQFTQEVAIIYPGDKLMLYTDGIIEAESANGSPLGIAGLIDLLQPAIHRAAAEVGESLIDGIKRWTNKPLRDDIYLLIAALK
ncbi:MAG: SpoIIE family protein phosphatase, partial [candidate division KSB1 bacterium]|nr:SpoIIE family protein phosphatase [candidate division KSB1 bacterium]